MGALDYVKEVIALAQTVDNVDLLRALTRLEGEVRELTQRVRELEDENARLNEAFAFSKQLVFRNDAMWTEEGGGPYCSRCWEVDRRAMRMHAKANPAYTVCPECETMVRAFPNKDIQGPGRIIRG